MKKGYKKVFSWCLIVSFLLTQILMASAAFGQSLQSKRLSGSDRYKTAVAISQKGWPAGSYYAVLARGDNFADALCAGPLAKKYNAPILLTQTNELNSDVLVEIKRLKTEHVIIIGGTGAVSESIETALKSAGIADIQRIFGSDRYETSVKIAEKLNNVNKIVVASGDDYPDALSISSIASKMGMPILLTSNLSMPDKVKGYIDSKKIDKAYIVGGIGAVSNDVKNIVPNSVRLGGKNRYETNTIIMKEFSDNLSFINIYAAVGEGPNGDEFADALTGAVLAARTSSPLILVNNSLTQESEEFIKSKVNIGSRVTALGGDGVVPQVVIDKIMSYVNLIPVKASYDKQGTYGPSEGTETIAGNVIIGVPDVTLQNTVIDGDLLLAEGIGNGNAYLKNVTVKGATIVRGGGPNSVVMYNFNGQTVVVDVPDGGSVRLMAQGTTSIGSLEMNSSGRLEESNLTGNGFTDVIIPEGAVVTLSGSFDTVNIDAGRANVAVENCTIGTLNANAPSLVSGTGTINTANINSEDVTITLNPNSTNVAGGITANVGGRQVTGGQNQQSSSGGGGGGGGASVPGTIDISNIQDITIKVGESRSVTATVIPADASISAVSSSDKVQISSIEGNTIRLTGISEGTASITVTASKQGYNNKTAAFNVSSPVKLYRTTQASPIQYFDTIGEALAAANENYTIEVAPGVYNESALTITVPNLKLIGPNKDKAGSGQRSSEAVINGNLDIKANGVTISGFTLNYSYSENPAIGYNDSTYVVNINQGYTGANISNNVVTKTIATLDWEEDENWLSRTGQAAIMSSGTNGDLSITGNKISFGPIAVKRPIDTTPTTSAIITGNTVTSTYDEGIWIVKADSITLEGNTISNFSMKANTDSKALKIVERPGTIKSPGTINGGKVEGRFQASLESQNSIGAENAHLQWIRYVNNAAAAEWYGIPGHFSTVSEAMADVPDEGTICVAASKDRYALNSVDNYILINKSIVLEGPQAYASPSDKERDGGEAILDAKDSLVGIAVGPGSTDVLINGFTLINAAAGLVAGSAIRGVLEARALIAIEQVRHAKSIIVQSNRFVDNFVGTVLNNLDSASKFNDVKFIKNFFGPGTYEGPFIGAEDSNAAIFGASASEDADWLKVIGDIQDSYNSNSPSARVSVGGIGDIVKRLSIGALLLSPEAYEFADNNIYGMTIGIAVGGDKGDNSSKLITHNYIHGNIFGFGMLLGANGVKINENNIQHNTVGLANITTKKRTKINATRNWWGTVDNIEISRTVFDLYNILQGGSTVEYFPWATNESCTEFAKYIIQVDDDWKDYTYRKQVVVDGNSYYIGVNAFPGIQAAIDSIVIDNEEPTINVAPGNYAENIVIKKPLTLKGPGIQQEADKEAAIKGIIKIRSDNVEIDRLRIEHQVNDDSYTIKIEHGRTGFSIKNNKIIRTISGGGSDEMKIYSAIWADGENGNITIKDNIIENGSVSIMGANGTISITGNNIKGTWHESISITAGSPTAVISNEDAIASANTISDFCLDTEYMLGKPVKVLQYGVSDAYEPDDFANAKEVSTDGVHQIHTLNHAGDIDWVKFNVTTDTVGYLYKIETSNLWPFKQMNTVITLYHADGNPVLDSSNNIITNNNGNRDTWLKASKIQWIPDSDGVYYVKIEHKQKGEIDACDVGQYEIYIIKTNAS